MHDTARMRERERQAHIHKKIGTMVDPNRVIKQIAIIIITNHKSELFN